MAVTHYPIPLLCRNSTHTHTLMHTRVLADYRSEQIQGLIVHVVESRREIHPLVFVDWGRRFDRWPSFRCHFSWNRFINLDRE